MIVTRRTHRVLLAVPLLLSACASPLWQFDRFPLKGELAGKSCTLQTHGVPGLPDTVETRQGLERHTEEDEFPEVEPGQTVKHITRRRLMIMLQGPRGELPGVGMYSVSADQWNAPPKGTVLVGLTDDRISAGLWPLVQSPMVDLAAVKGTVWLDSVVATAVYGRFDVGANRVVAH